VNYHNLNLTAAGAALAAKQMDEEIRGQGRSYGGGIHS